MMADSRNDLSTLSPSSKGNKYLVMTSQSAEGVKTNATIDSSNLGIASQSSNTSTPRKTLMTESEINSLVHDALMKARQATKSFSPRTNTYSPRSANSQTPGSTRSAGMPQARVSSPLSASNNGRLPANSVSSTPSKKKISVPSLGVTSRDSIDSPYGSNSKFQLPPHLRSSLSALSNRSAPKLDYQVDVGEQLSMQSSMAVPSISTVGSTNSSDDIIRRVEEEIANARRAAQEATRRLAGVSANFMSEANHSNPKIPKSLGTTNISNRESNLDTHLDQMMAETNGSSSTDEDKNFDSALDLIGEEFDEIVAGRSGNSEVADEKKEEDSNSGRFYLRNRSVEPLSLDYLSAHERNTWSTKGSTLSKNDEEDNISGIKAVVNINKSLDDFHIYELEAVLSDEREMDRLAMKAQETSAKSSPVEPASDGEANSIAQDGNDEQEKTIESMPTSQEMIDSPESKNTLSDEESSVDQDIEEVDSQQSIENLDEKESEEMSLSPELSISISVSASNDSLPDGSIEHPVKLMDTHTSENKSFVNTETGDKYPDSSEHEDSALGSPKSATSANSTDASENINKNSFKDNDNLLALNESKDDSTMQRRDDAATISNAISEDQITDVASNTSPLTDKLLSDFLVPKTHPAPSGAKESPSKKLPISKTKIAVDSKYTPRNGTKVTFKERYPIPQKIKKFREPSEILQDNQVEKQINNLWLSMPKPELKELFDAVTGTSIQRRSNACGALKVMSTQKKNQLTLVRTQGFMDALVCAISDDYSVEDSEPGRAARTRAVNVVLNVSTKKDNRYHVLLHPGLRKSLVKCMTEDDGEARELACAVLATLAKSQKCRGPIGKTEKIVDALATILNTDDKQIIAADLEEAKTDYSGDDELSAVVSNSFSSSASSSRSSSTRSSSIGSSHGADSMELHKEDPEMLRRTRMNACAALMHLSKECFVSQELCASDALLSSLVSCCKEVQNPMHTKCLEILANLTRFPHNNARIVQFPDLVDVVLLNGSQEDDSDRLWSMRILQNITSEPSAKTRLATTSVLELLSTNMMGKLYEEQLAAISAMYNISTEPGAVVPLTNTKNVVAALVHVAHSPASVMEVRTIACDALSTIGLWLQTLSSSGSVPEGVKPVALPSYITSGWQRWDE